MLAKVVIFGIMNSLFIGQNIIRFKNIDSTNNYAAQLLRQTVIFEGTVVISEFQEKGKGQRGNEWESEANKNLTFSTILNPSFLKSGQQFLLNKVISLAICDYLKSLEIADLSVKWPNDILVKGKKIAGILIENIIRSNDIVHSIIGIGFNVNQTKFLSAANPTSLKIITGKNFIVEECFEKICNCIEAKYLKLKSNITSADEDYLYSLFQFNEWKNYSMKEKNFSAKIIGITSVGQLVLQQENGEKFYCSFKEVQFL